MRCECTLLSPARGRRRLMMRIDSAFSETVARAVRDAERGTSAEIVVVVAARSGSYLDVALVGGALCAAAALAGALFAPATIHPAWVMVEIPIVFGAGAWLVHRAGAILGRMIPSARARMQVERAAASHFVSEAVHGVRGRTGLLVYVSRLEGRVAIVPDLGLDAAVHRPVWSTVRFAESGEVLRVRSTQDLLRGIAGLGELLRERAPVGRDDVNELPDAPRIVP